MSEEERPEPVEIPADELAPETLRAVIEAFVLREGTDYGEREVSFERKIQDVRSQLDRGDARIVYDPGTETVTLVSLD